MVVCGHYEVNGDAMKDYGQFGKRMMKFVKSNDRDNDDAVNYFDKL